MISVSLEALAALATYAFVTSITPGPNNLMLMASGTNFGIRRTLPHLLGVSLGHGLVVLVCGLGLADLFERIPEIRAILTLICSLYLLWLAWKIATATPRPETLETQEAAKNSKPLTALQAAIFQWVNPKGLYMAITAQTYYAPEGSGWVGAAYVTLGFVCVNFPCVAVWAWFGTQIKRYLGTYRRLRNFNIAMGLLLVAALGPILAEIL